MLHAHDITNGKNKTKQTSYFHLSPASSTSCTPGVCSSRRHTSRSMALWCAENCLLGRTVHLTPSSTPSLGPRLRRVHRSVRCTHE
jgi:hypothetical protein